MYKDYRYINAGENEIYRFGKKARERVQACMVSENGYLSIPADGGKYWTIGTSEGKFGEFAKYHDTFFSVNKGGYVYAKEGTDKAVKLLEFMQGMINEMTKLDEARFNSSSDDEE